MKIGVVYIHGVHGYTHGYADQMHEGAVDAADVELFGKDDLEIIPRTVYWADIFDAQRESLRKSAEGLGWKSLRGFVATSVAHAVGYEDTVGVGAYEAVHARIDAALASLAAEIGPDSPVIICAHSLGTIIASNYIWDRQHEAAPRPTGVESLASLRGLITMGCPIALYASRWPEGGRSFKAATAGIIWQNLIARSDVLAWPVAPINPDYTREVEADICVKVGGFLGWTPVAHCNYWNSVHVADKLGEMIARVYWDTKRKVQ